MMRAKQKIPEKSDKKDQLDPSGALKTEEILSLLSKTDQGFIKESEISSNISKLFKKTSLSEVAKKPEKIEEKDSPTPDKLEEKLKKEILEKDSPKENEEIVKEEKKYNEEEAKKMANDLAKDYYHKGYNLGIKKTKEELEKGEKALAVALKNLTDNIFSITPEFTKKINESIQKNLLKITREVLGYEIDTKTDFFLKKIQELTDSIESKFKKIQVQINKEDHDSITKYLSENNFDVNIEIISSEKLKRGDLKIKYGSIEIGEIVSEKIKFSPNDNLKNELSTIKEKNKKLTENHQPQKKEIPQK